MHFAFLNMLQTSSVGTFITFIAYFSIFDVELVQGGGFLYLPINGTKPNNTMAQAICKSYRTCELAVVDSQSEYDRMMQYFNQTLGAGFILPAAVWIGLYWLDVTGLGNYSYMWKTGGSTQPFTWAKWDGGEPNGLGYENCARIHTNLYYRSIQCSGGYDVLCEGTGGSTCIAQQDEDLTKECKPFASCWWTPARIGLTAGFTSLFTFFCICCIGWKCVCAPKAKVGYDIGDDEDDDDDANNDMKNGHHNILKNHNVEEAPFGTPSQSRGINSVILQSSSDTSWMSVEEKSFSARHLYKY